MYEVYSNYGSALFETENDAINALFLLGHYHEIDINHDEAKTVLEKSGRFEVFPLVIQQA